MANVLNSQDPRAMVLLRYLGLDKQPIRSLTIRMEMGEPMVLEIEKLVPVEDINPDALSIVEEKESQKLLHDFLENGGAPN